MNKIKKKADGHLKVFLLVFCFCFLNKEISNLTWGPFPQNKLVAVGYFIAWEVMFIYRRNSLTEKWRNVPDAVDEALISPCDSTGNRIKWLLRYSKISVESQIHKNSFYDRFSGKKQWTVSQLFSYILIPIKKILGLQSCIIRTLTGLALNPCLYSKS